MLFRFLLRRCSPVCGRDFYYIAALHFNLYRCPLVGSEIAEFVHRDTFSPSEVPVPSKLYNSIKLKRRNRRLTCAQTQFEFTRTPCPVQFAMYKCCIVILMKDHFSRSFWRKSRMPKSMESIAFSNRSFTALALGSPIGGRPRTALRIFKGYRTALSGTACAGWSSPGSTSPTANCA